MSSCKRTHEVDENFGETRAIVWAWVGGRSTAGGAPLTPRRPEPTHPIEGPGMTMSHALSSPASPIVLKAAARSLELARTVRAPLPPGGRAARPLRLLCSLEPDERTHVTAKPGRGRHDLEILRAVSCSGTFVLDEVWQRLELGAATSVRRSERQSRWFLRPTTTSPGCSVGGVVVQWGSRTVEDVGQAFPGVEHALDASPILLLGNTKPRCSSDQSRSSLTMGRNRSRRSLRPGINRCSRSSAGMPGPISGREGAVQLAQRS